MKMRSAWQRDIDAVANAPALTAREIRLRDRNEAARNRRQETARVKADAAARDAAEAAMLAQWDAMLAKPNPREEMKNRSAATLSPHQQAALLWLLQKTIHGRKRHPDPEAQLIYGVGREDARGKEMGLRTAYVLEGLGLVTLRREMTTYRVGYGLFGRQGKSAVQKNWCEVGATLTPEGEAYARSLANVARSAR